MVVGRDLGLMIRALAASLEDDDILVRRGVLELLNQSFKIDSKAFKSSSGTDQEILMRAAAGVVLRRDLSLSRRLYTWLLGKEEASEAQVAYFRQHGLELLRKTLKVCGFPRETCPSDGLEVGRNVCLFFRRAGTAPVQDLHFTAG